MAMGWGNLPSTLRSEFDPWNTHSGRREQTPTVHTEDMARMCLDTQRREIKSDPWLLILAFWRQRQLDLYELQVRLIYKVSSRMAWETQWDYTSPTPLPPWDLRERGGGRVHKVSSLMWFKYKIQITNKNYQLNSRGNLNYWHRSGNGRCYLRDWESTDIILSANKSDNLREMYNIESPTSGTPAKNQNYIRALERNSICKDGAKPQADSLVNSAKDKDQQLSVHSPAQTTAQRQNCSGSSQAAWLTPPTQQNSL